MFSSYSGIVSGSVSLLFLSTALTISAQSDELKLFSLTKFSVSFTTLDFFAMEWISGVVFSVSSFVYVSSKVRLRGMDTFFPFLHHFILFSSAADVVLSIMLVSQQPFY